MLPVRIAALVVALLALTVTPLIAQSRVETRRIAWYLSIQGAAIADAPRTHRVYQETEDIQLRLHVSNQFDTPIFVDQSVLRPSLGLRVMTGPEPVAVSAEWLPFVRRTGLEAFRDPVYVLDTESVRVDGNEGVFWFIALRRANGDPLGPGEYRVEVEMRPAVAAFRTESGGPWTGPPILDATDLTVVVARPESIEEQVREAKTAGSDAMFVGNTTAAASHYLRATQLDPTDTDARGRLGAMYLVLQRYDEATVEFEAVVSRSGAHPRDVEALAQAYVGAGNDAAAQGVLFSRGLIGPALSAKLEELRDIVRRRR